jgi:hypothetical protein
MKKCEQYGALGKIYEHNGREVLVGVGKDDSLFDEERMTLMVNIRQSNRH